MHTREHVLLLPSPDSGSVTTETLEVQTSRLYMKIANGSWLWLHPGNHLKRWLLAEDLEQLLGLLPRDGDEGWEQEAK